MDPRWEETSRALVRLTKNIKVLSAISWPEDFADEFVADWKRGNMRLPELPPRRRVSKKLIGSLDRIIEQTTDDDPVGLYLRKTARSYRTAVQLLSETGTPAFHELSRKLYGGPRGRIRGSEMDHRELADRVLESSAALAAAVADEDDESLLIYDAETAAKKLRKRWTGFFKRPLRVVVDTKLAAKAAASANRVRIRAGTRFSAADVSQLAEHEIGVHSLTSRNGREQHIVSALSLGSPRTTATQEGLATFAELVTGSIDLARLRRIALRIRAISLAESGADFVELFRNLLEEGEPPGEAVRTTMRIFRGGDVRGRYVFTKDTVYLKGLFAVHTFMRKAIAEHRPELIHRLFSGRMTLGDVLLLEPAFDDGTVDPPHYVPPWAQNMRGLAAYLAISALVDHIDLSSVELEDH